MLMELHLEAARSAPPRDTAAGERHRQWSDRGPQGPDLANGLERCRQVGSLVVARACESRSGVCVQARLGRCGSLRRSASGESTRARQHFRARCGSAMLASMLSVELSSLVRSAGSSCFGGFGWSQLPRRDGRDPRGPRATITLPCQMHSRLNLRIKVEKGRRWRRRRIPRSMQ